MSYISIKFACFSIIVFFNAPSPLEETFGYVSGKGCSIFFDETKKTIYRQTYEVLSQILVDEGSNFL